MRFSSALLRRRRGSAYGSTALTLLCRGYGKPSLLRTFTSAGVAASVNSASSSSLAFSPSPSTASCVGTVNALVMSRRFEASSSSLATAVSTAAKQRHRRGAHRKRGCGSSNNNSTVGGEGITPSAHAAVAHASAVNTSVDAALTTPSSGTVEAAEPKTSKKQKAEAVEAGVAPVEEGVRASEVSAHDGDADAIMMELITSSMLNGLNDHTSKASEATAAADTSTDSVSPNLDKQVHQERVETAEEFAEGGSALVGMELTKHHRNSRTRSSRCRRGLKDGRASLVESAETPPLVEAEEAVKVSKTEADAVDATGEVKAAEVPSKKPAAVEETKKETVAADDADDDMSVDAAAHGRRRKSKRSRRSSSAPLPQEATETPAMEEGHSPSAVAVALPKNNPRVGTVARAAVKELDYVCVPTAGAAAVPAAASSSSPPSASAVLLKDAPTTSSTQRPLPKRRSQRGKRGRASESGDAAQVGAAPATTATEAKEDVVKAPMSWNALSDRAEAPFVAAEDAVTLKTISTAAATNTIATAASNVTAPAAVAAAAADAVKEDVGADTKVKKRRGRKKKSVATAADAVPPATPANTTREIEAAENAVVKTATSGSGAQTGTDADLPKSAAAAIKKLFAADAHDSSNSSGGAMSSLAAQRRLAAQIIRKRWQLQQELKARKKEAAAAAASTQLKQQHSNKESHEKGELQQTVKRAVEPPTTVPTAAIATVDGSAPLNKADDTPTRKKRPRKSSKRCSAAAPVTTAETGEALTASPPVGAAQDDMDAPSVGAEGINTTAAASKSTISTTTADAHSEPATLADVEESAQDAEVAAAVKTTFTLAAMAETDPSASETTASASAVGAAATTNITSSDAEGATVETSSNSDEADNAVAGTPRSLAKLVARSQNVVTSAAARAAIRKSAKSNGKGGATTGDNNDNSGSNSSSGGRTKGANSKDALYFPDYRERVVHIFEQMAEINGALGERYKALSYSNSVERLKRNDVVFQLLPPNMLPLPEDSPKWKAPVFDASTPEAVMAVAQRRAREVEENRARRKTVLSSENLIPGVGHKLRVKIVEILETGDLQELHKLEAKPLIRAIRELTQVHGFGPRTAIEFFKKYNITTVKELQDYAVEKGELDMSNKATGKPAGLNVSTSNAQRAGFHLTDAQRLGLVYYKDMCHRIPHEEGRLHEAFMKLRLRKYLGNDYELVVCGSYRRQVEASGDIDVLITRKRVLEGDVQSTTSSHLPPADVLRAFLSGLKADRYIEATLAQGPTKFMGLCRLRALPPPGGKKAIAKTLPLPSFRARRLDIRYVDVNCFPAAMLYFTGSKNFNVIMRSEAIKKRCILNEYGLFRKFSQKQQLQRQASGEKPYNLHEMITRLARFGFASIKEIMENNGNPESAVSEESDDAAAGNSVLSAGKKIRKKSKEKTQAEIAELCEIAKVVERQRVKAYTEKEIFDALDMSYVQPKDRNV